jgi:hypothetical protein
MTNRDVWLPVYFFGYLVGVGLLYLFLPRLLRQPYLMPWDYWWLFLFVTPTIAAGILGWQVRTGRLSRGAAVAFVVAAVLLGAFLGWFSFELSGVV